MSMKNSNDTIGNRTRDLPACSAVPQSTAPSLQCLYMHSGPYCAPRPALKVTRLPFVRRDTEFSYCRRISWTPRAGGGGALDGTLCYAGRVKTSQNLISPPNADALYHRTSLSSTSITKIITRKDETNQLFS
jgi:hypothetical protein